MKLYLSSYRVGDFGDSLQKLVDRPNAKVAIIANALDWSTDKKKTEEGVQREINDMKGLGFNPTLVDLREFFDKPGLVDYLCNFDLVWVRGGNTFILMKAMKQSGFDQVIDQLIKPGKLIYAGYSAAFSVISPSLDGVELVDDINATAYGYDDIVARESYGLIDFYPIVHFRSNHHESDDVEKEYEYVKSQGIKYKTFKDGDVYIVNGDYSQVLINDQ